MLTSLSTFSPLCRSVGLALERFERQLATRSRRTLKSAYPSEGRLHRPGLEAVVESVLAQVPLFAALDAESAATLEAMLTTRTLARGHVVFREGDTGDRLFVVLDGKVKISRAAADGRENLLAVLGATEMFGELSLFDPGPRTATVTTVTEATLASLDHDDLRPLLTERPGSPYNCSRRWPSDCAAPTRRWPTWSSPTSRAGSRRRCWILPRSSATPEADGHPGPPRPHPGRARPARGRQPGDRSTRRCRSSRTAAGCGSRAAASCCSTPPNGLDQSQGRARACLSGHIPSVSETERAITDRPTTCKQAT